MKKWNPVELTQKKSKMELCKISDRALKLPEIDFLSYIQ